MKRAGRRFPESGTGERGVDQYEATSSNSKRVFHREGMPQEKSNVRGLVPEQDKSRRGCHNDNENQSMGKESTESFLPRDCSERKPMHLRSAVAQDLIEETGAN